MCLSAGKARRHWTCHQKNVADDGFDGAAVGYDFDAVPVAHAVASAVASAVADGDDYVVVGLSFEC